MKVPDSESPQPTMATLKATFYRIPQKPKKPRRRPKWNHFSSLRAFLERSSTSWSNASDISWWQKRPGTATQQGVLGHPSPGGHRCFFGPTKLFSSYCSKLQSYRHSVGWTNSLSCPKYKATNSTLAHLSSCHTHLTDQWLQLHVSLVHVSACSFAVSQASDLALLVGYVA